MKVSEKFLLVEIEMYNLVLYLSVKFSLKCLGGRNTCQGDSGGPVVFYDKDHYVVEGLVSWGNKDDCAGPGFFGGFVRVRNFVHWISAYVGK